MSPLTTKRLVDLVGATLGLLLLSPLFAIVALLVRLQLGAPVLFRQTRGGYANKAIQIYKFRTMHDLFDENGELLHDSKRITPLGAFLRKTSLDELPTLLNVLRGDMSLVGPRPLLYRYIERYSPEQKRRHEVKPGITGWAQVNGRNTLTWEEKFKLDVWYIDNQGLWLDLRILCMTVVATLTQRGINAAESDTMPEFMGAETAHPSQATKTKSLADAKASSLS